MATPTPKADALRALREMKFKKRAARSILGQPERERAMALLGEATNRAKASAARAKAKRAARSKR